MTAQIPNGFYAEIPTVYKVEFANGEYLIGATRQPFRRKHDYKHEYHYNNKAALAAFQASNKKFVFTVIETTSLADMHKIEVKHINKHINDPKCLNVRTYQAPTEITRKVELTTPGGLTMEFESVASASRFLGYKSPVPVVKYLQGERPWPTKGPRKDWGGRYLT